MSYTLKAYKGPVKVEKSSPTVSKKDSGKLLLLRGAPVQQFSLPLTRTLLRPNKCSRPSHWSMDPVCSACFIDNMKRSRTSRKPCTKHHISDNNNCSKPNSDSVLELHLIVSTRSGSIHGKHDLFIVNYTVQ